MATAAATPTPKVSWLKKVGQDIVKALSVVGKVVLPVVQKALPVVQTAVEAAVPASAPVFNVVDNIMGIIITDEAAFAAASSQPSGPQKLEAAIPLVGTVLQQYVADNFPGSSSVPSQATIAMWTNAAVALLNDIDPAAVPAAGSPAATAQQTAVLAAAAVKAVINSTPQAT